MEKKNTISKLVNQRNKTDNETRVRIFLFVYELKSEYFVGRIIKSDVELSYLFIYKDICEKNLLYYKLFKAVLYMCITLWKSASMIYRDKIILMTHHF